MKKKYLLASAFMAMTLASCNGGVKDSSNLDSSSLSSDSSSTIMESSSNVGSSSSAETIENGLFFQSGKITDILSNFNKMYYYVSSDVHTSTFKGLEDGYFVSLTGNYDANNVQMFMKNEGSETGKEYSVSMMVTSTREGKLWINGEIIDLLVGDNEVVVNYTEDDIYSLKIVFGDADNSEPYAMGNITFKDITFSNGSTSPSVEPVVVNGITYNIKWADEFEGTTVDDSKWSYDIGNGDWGWGNNEKQYYRKENATVSDGVLNITAKKESYGNCAYTSSRMVTRDKYYFQYGYVEARLALPRAMGIWPAFWTLAKNNNWPYTGEIDIMEAINDENKVYSTLHWNNGSSYSPAECGSGTDGLKGTTLDDRTTFHTYAMQWESSYMRFFVDGIQIYAYSIDSADKRNAFNREHYLILNVAVGGTWPGMNIADAFPQAMSVDYVRVYQQN